MQRFIKQPTPVRILGTVLFLIAMPLTLADSSGPGVFADTDGWQGYEIVFWWPLIFTLMGSCLFLPLVLSPVYVLLGLWIKLRPLWLYCLAWFLGMVALVLIASGGTIYRSFWILVVAWVFLGVSALADFAEAEVQESTVDHSSSNPQVPSNSQSPAEQVTGWKRRSRVTP